jgi:hypothetical protein
LSVRDRERSVQVSPLGEIGWYELRSWHQSDSLKKTRSTYTPGYDFLNEIFLMTHGIIMHLLHQERDGLVPTGCIVFEIPSRQVKIASERARLTVLSVR